MKNTRTLALPSALLIGLALVSGCKGDEKPADPPKAAAASIADSAKPKVETKPADEKLAEAKPAEAKPADVKPADVKPADETHAAAGDLSTPKGSIAYQLKLLNEGKVDELKACFTARVKDKITKENVEKGKAEVAKAHMSLDEMVNKVEEKEEGGVKRAKIRMKEGNLMLTTLVLTDGKWLADTIWFK